MKKIYTSIIHKISQKHPVRDFFVENEQEQYALQKKFPNMKIRSFQDFERDFVGSLIKKDRDACLITSMDKAELLQTFIGNQNKQFNQVFTVPKLGMSLFFHQTGGDCTKLSYWGTSAAMMRDIAEALQQQPFEYPLPYRKLLYEDNVEKLLKLCQDEHPNELEWYLRYFCHVFELDVFIPDYSNDLHANMVNDCLANNTFAMVDVESQHLITFAYKPQKHYYLFERWYYEVQEKKRKLEKKLLHKQNTAFLLQFRYFSNVDIIFKKRSFSTKFTLDGLKVVGALIFLAYQMNGASGINHLQQFLWEFDDEDLVPHSVPDETHHTVEDDKGSNNCMIDNIQSPIMSRFRDIIQGNLLRQFHGTKKCVYGRSHNLINNLKTAFQKRGTLVQCLQGKLSQIQTSNEPPSPQSALFLNKPGKDYIFLLLDFPLISSRFFLQHLRRLELQTGKTVVLVENAENWKTLQGYPRHKVISHERLNHNVGNNSMFILSTTQKWSVPKKERSSYFVFRSPQEITGFVNFFEYFQNPKDYGLPEPHQYGYYMPECLETISSLNEESLESL